MERTLKSYVTRRLAELGVNPFEAARRVGLERGFINDILQGKKSSIRGKNIIKLAEALDVSVAVLVEETLESGPPGELLDWIAKSDPKKIDMFNIIKHADGFCTIDRNFGGNITVRNFAHIFRIDYIITVYEDNMDPELRPGDRAFIDENYPPVPDNTYLFRTDGHKYTKVCFGKLISIDSQQWVIKQWHPEQEIRLKREEWTRCHRVAGKLAR